MGMIYDGTGTNLRAAVKSDEVVNRLQVSSESIPYEGARAVSGRSGIIHGVCYFGASSSGGLLSIENTSTTRNIVLTRLYFDAHVLAAPVQIVQVKAPATITGGEDTTTTSRVQKNYGSQVSHAMVVTQATSGNTMSYTGGEEYHNFSMSSLQSQNRNMNSTNIIPPGTKVIWGFYTSRVGAHNMGGTESISLSLNYISVEA